MPDASLDAIRFQRPAAPPASARTRCEDIQANSVIDVQAEARLIRCRLSFCTARRRTRRGGDHRRLITIAFHPREITS
jgi:hypothetical protein